MKKDVLGVKIDDISINEAVSNVESWLSKGGKHYIVTPNPEMIVAAQSDQYFKKILNDADLAIPDGAGLKLAGIINNLPGVDLMEMLVKTASERGYTIGLLGGKGGVAKKAAERLVAKYPNLKVIFSGEKWKDISPRKSTDMLFVAFGHIKQEKWIAKNLDKLPVKVAMGVGGSFDYLSGQVPRAPERIRSLGLEWLFRLIVQPWRIKRQLTLLKYIWLLTRKQFLG